MRHIIASLLVFAISCNLYGAASAKPSTVPAHRSFSLSKPNVILIIADDHGYADFSHLGIHDFIRTPNLDRLTAEGMWFSDAYATSPICNPSRCGLVTGQYQQRQGTQWYGGPGIPETVTTIAEGFKQAGYRTGYVGKLHYGKNDEPDSPSYPLNHGFDESFCAAPGGRVHYLHHSEAAVERYGEAARQMCVGPFTRNGEKYEFEGFDTETFSSEAQAFIEKNQDTPFFLQLAFTAAHNFTFQLPDAYLKEWNLPKYPDWDPEKESYNSWYERSITPNLPNARLYYAAQLYYMDREIGHIRSKLKELGLDRNTIIVYTSDNGGSSCNAGDNTPLNGGKYTMFEGGLRVPLIFYWPGRTESGAKTDTMTCGFDLMPTLLSAAGAPVASYAQSDGLNLLPLITDGEPLDRETLHWDVGFQWAVRQGKWKLKVVVDEDKAGSTGSKQHVELGHGIELYNLDEDEGENYNLASTFPEVVQRLTKLHDQWRSEVSSSGKKKEQ